MAIEIKELAIKATVDNSTQTQTNAPPVNIEQLTAQVVDQVLRILARKESR